MSPSPDPAKIRAAQVRMMIFDVDGVLTDGRMLYGPDGEMMKSFNVMDGLGIQLLGKADIATAIISARQSPIVTKRAADLGIRYVYQGHHDKRIALRRLLEDSSMQAEECGYMGDDLIDLPLFSRVGFRASVSSAHAEVRSRADFVSNSGGGLGGVREVCEFILRAQNKFQTVLDAYLA